MVFGKYQIHHCDVLRQEPPIESNSIHCVATSPPYWNLRDYGVEGQIGNEEIHDCLGWATGAPCGECYVCHMVQVFRRIRRVLRDDGVAWLNIGDSYSGGGRGNYDTKSSNKGNHASRGLGRKSPPGLKSKDLCLIPHRVALALQADGWYLRAAPPWIKRSAMPQSVADRPSTATETFFMLTKSERYYYDIEATKIPAAYGLKGSSFTKGKTVRRDVGEGDRDDLAERNRRDTDWWLDSIQLIAKQDQYGMVTGEDSLPLGFDVTNSGFKGAHFACWPPKLVMPCLKASTSEKGCCPTCGSPWVRIVERDRIPTRPASDSKVGRASVHGQSPYNGHAGSIVGNRDPKRHQTTTHTVGWEQGCECSPADPVQCRVYDPFNGAASTAVACMDLNLDYVGTDINPAYIEMSLKRLADHRDFLRTGVKSRSVDPDSDPDQLPLFGAVA